MKRAKYRVGVLGLDHWYIALGQVPAFARHPKFELAAVWEPQKWRLKDLEAKPERVVARPQDITDAPDIDLVISLLPCPANIRWLTRAALHGKALLCNKPLGMSPAACRPLVRALARRRLASFSYEGARTLSAPMKFVRRLILNGAVGRPAAGYEGGFGGMPQAWRGAKGTGRRAWGWWTDPRSVPGGAWIDHAIYSIPMFRFLLGDEPKKVSAVMGNLVHPRREFGLEDYGTATYTFGRGAAVTLEDTWFGWMGLPSLVVGTKGKLKWGPGFNVTEVELSDARGTRTLKVPPGLGERLPDHMARCLDRGTDTRHPAREGMENLRIAMAAYRAARLGRSVRV